MTYPKINANRAAIEAAPIYGNAYSDQNLMNAIHEFVCDVNTPTPDALWALDYLAYNVMGFSEAECPPSDTESLIEYIQEYRV